MKSNSEEIVMLFIQASKLKKVHRPVIMKYRWIEKDRRRDKDNVSSYGRKVIQDALVKSGILANDGWANIVGFTDEFAIDKMHPRIEVEIEEVNQ